MIVHHMADGSTRDSIDGIIIPKNFKNIYELANRIKKESSNGNSVKSKVINK